MRSALTRLLLSEKGQVYYMTQIHDINTNAILRVSLIDPDIEFYFVHLFDDLICSEAAGK